MPRLLSRRPSPSSLVPSTASPPYSGETSMSSSTTSCAVSPPGVFDPEDRLGGYLRVTHWDDESARLLWTRAIPILPPTTFYLLEWQPLTTNSMRRLLPYIHLLFMCRWASARDILTSFRVRTGGSRSDRSDIRGRLGQANIFMNPKAKKFLVEHQRT